MTNLSFEFVNFMPKMTNLESLVSVSPTNVIFCSLAPLNSNWLIDQNSAELPKKKQKTWNKLHKIFIKVIELIVNTSAGNEWPYFFMSICHFCLYDSFEKCFLLEKFMRKKKAFYSRRFPLGKFVVGDPLGLPAPLMRVDARFAFFFVAALAAAYCSQFSSLQHFFPLCRLVFSPPCWRYLLTSSKIIG